LLARVLEELRRERVDHGKCEDQPGNDFDLLHIPIVLQAATTSVLEAVASRQRDSLVEKSIDAHDWQDFPIFDAGMAPERFSGLLTADRDRLVGVAGRRCDTASFAFRGGCARLARVLGTKHAVRNTRKTCG